MLEILNNDIWYYTIKYIQIEDFISLYLTCKYFNKIFSDDIYWKYLIIYKYPILYPKQIWIHNYKELIKKILIIKKNILNKQCCFRCNKELGKIHKFMMCNCLNRLLCFHKECIEEFVCSYHNEYINQYTCPFCNNYCIGYTGNTI